MNLPVGTDGLELRRAVADPRNKRKYLRCANWGTGSEVCQLESIGGVPVQQQLSLLGQYS